MLVALARSPDKILLGVSETILRVDSGYWIRKFDGYHSLISCGGRNMNLQRGGGIGKLSHQLVSPKYSLAGMDPGSSKKAPDHLDRARRARLRSPSSATPKTGDPGSQEPQVHHLFIRDSKPHAQGNYQPPG